MSHIFLRGTSENVAILLRLMADEMEQDGCSSAAFSDHPGEKPSHRITCQRVNQPEDTTVHIYR